MRVDLDFWDFHNVLRDFRRVILALFRYPASTGVLVFHNVFWNYCICDVDCVSVLVRAYFCILWTCGLYQWDVFVSV